MLLNWPKTFGKKLISTPFQLNLKIKLRPEMHVSIANPFISSQNHLRVIFYVKYEPSQDSVNISEAPYRHLVFQAII